VPAMKRPSSYARPVPGPSVIHRGMNKAGRWRSCLPCLHALLLAAIPSSVLADSSGGSFGTGLLFASARAERPVEIRLEPYMGALRTIVTVAGPVVESGASGFPGASGDTARRAAPPDTTPDALPFLFDTGGGGTLLTPKTAERAGCVPFGRATGFRLSGERLDSPLCDSMAFRIGAPAGYAVRLESGVFDLMRLLPPDWPELGGLLSLHSFEGRAITLDLRADLLIVETDSSLAERVRHMRPMRARIGRQSGGGGVDLFVQARARRGTLWLELDSGNLGPVLLAPHALEQLGARAPADSAAGRSEGAESGWHVPLELVGLPPLDVAIEQREMIYDGVLNAAAMKRMVLTMDLRDGSLWGMLHGD